MADETKYPTPKEHPNCKCWPNMMRAFYCMTGHMTECHYPMSCEEAECDHYLAEREMGEWNE